MTIIASYQRKNDVLLLGDLILSGSQEVTNAIDIPTRFNSTQPEVNKYFSGLSQKVLVVNANLAVAWAGSKIVAKHLIKRISSEIPEPYTPEKILDLIYRSGLNRTELEAVSFIFLGADPEKRTLFVQDYLTGETSLDAQQKFKYAGSGQDHFLKNMGFNFTGRSGQVNEFEMMVFSLAGRAASALLEEIISDTTHNHAYGASFEVLQFHPMEERFKKIPLTFVFWTHGESGIDLTGPIFALNYGETGFLYVHRLSRDPGGNWALKTFPISNLLNEEHPAPECSPPDFNTFFSVHLFVPEKFGSKPKMMLKKGENKNIAIRHDLEKRLVQIEVDSSFMDEVRAMHGEVIP